MGNRTWILDQSADTSKLCGKLNFLGVSHQVSELGGHKILSVLTMSREALRDDLFDLVNSLAEQAGLLEL